MHKLLNLPSLKININALSSETAHLWLKTHIHEAVEIVYVISGIAIIYINGKKITLNCGDIIIINRNAVHHIEDALSSELTYMQIEIQEYFDSVAKSDLTIYSFISQQLLRLYIHLTGKNEFKSIFLAIQKEITEKKPYYELYVNSLIRLVISFMYRNGMLDYADDEIRSDIKEFSSITSYIETNYTQVITLDTLAQLSGISKFELCRKFKSATGRTITDYVNYVRLCHEKELLKENKRITDIAYECGFSSVQYFNRTFKKYNGCSPGNYKNLCRIK